MLKQFLIDARVRLAAVFARRALRERADEEVQFHLSLVERRMIESGAPPEIARAQARRGFGNPTLIKEQTFDSWGCAFVDAVARISEDVQFAFRMMGRRPCFAISTALLLTLAIGVNTMAFSIVDAVWLRPLPYVDSNRIMAVWEKPPRNVKWKRQTLSWPDFLALRRDSRTFEVLAAASPRKYAAILNDRAESVAGEAVTAGYMAMLGVGALRGRAILPDDAPGALEVVLSHRLWQRSYGGRDVVGETVRLDSRSYTIVGVMPSEFTFPSLSEGQPDLWTMLASNAESPEENAGRVNVIGRLRSSATAEAAEAETTALLRQAHDGIPAAWRPQGMIVRDLQSDRAVFSAPMLSALIGAAALVLLMACANVAGLLLGHAAERRPEMAVRYALGAGQRRIVRQLLTENLALWMMAGAAGVAFSALGLHWVLPFASRVFEEFPQLNPIAVNSRAAVYALLLTLTTGTLFGLAPALQASRLDIAGGRKESGRSLVSGRRAHNLRKALVASEAGLSVVLLIGAGLLTKSFVQLATQPLGFHSGNDVTFKVELSGGPYREPGQRYRFYDRLLETMTELPGVEYAGATSALPLKGTVVSGYSILGRPAAPSDSTLAGSEAISPEYFEALGIPVVRGRAFNVRDSERAGPVAVINQTLAQRYFANEDPIGRRIKWGGSSSAAPWMTVVGVVGDVKHAGLDWDYLPLIYVPYRQIPAGYEGLAPEMFFVVRGAGRLALRNEIRAAISSLDRSAPVVDMMSMEEIIASKELPSELNSAIFGGFAVMALLLAAIGLYAIVSQSALERRKEIGIRIALGAAPRAVIGDAMREGVSLAAAGVVVGLAGGLGLTRFIRSMLYGVAVTDISIFLGVPALLLAIAALASFAPARRAASTDPLEALRCE